ncbi:glycosyl hydrolase family 5 [Opitutaceae bacterium TAV5]|nr:glycosyl hydrolase family 5 [Opitutaceae bacterium TAV5]
MSFSSLFCLQTKIVTALFFALSALPGVCAPEIIQAGPDWAPYDHPLDIAAGGVFDRSALVLADAPAGKYGRIITTPDGHFAFEKHPSRRARFWGVNLCFDSLFLDREKADQIADRFARAGYNTVRFHHFDQVLVKNRGLDGSHDIDPQKLDQLEYLFAAFKNRGIYITIDLYTSRHFPARELPEIGRPVQGEIRHLIPVSENAYNLWREFAKKLLTHQNPHTGLTWAADPALINVNMLNEESFFFGGISKRKPDILALYEKAYAAWRERQPDPKPPALTASLHDPARPAISPDDVTPDHQLPALAHPSATTHADRSADAAFNRFLVELKIASDARMAACLRDELGVRALIAGDNNIHTQAQTYIRQHYDLVDNHEYWNHPVRKGPHIGVNPRSAIVSSLWLPRELMPARIFGKPYIVTEYNYCFPSPARSEGGVLMPAWSALQDWDAIYLFDYSSRSRDNAAMFIPATTHKPGTGYVFSVVTDPIGMLSDRAAAFLFLHGNIRPAPDALAYLVTRDAAFDGPKGAPSKFPEKFSWLGLQTRIGSLPSDNDDSAKTLPVIASQTSIKAFITNTRSDFPKNFNPGRPVFPLTPHAPDGTRIANGLEKSLQTAALLPSAAADTIRATTGQMEINRTLGTARLVTDRAECFVTPANASLAGDRVAVVNGDTFATTWILAVDQQPLASTRRLLVLHLTDSLNTDMRYSDATRRVVEDLGTLPHLIRRGTTTLTLKLPSPSSTHWQAWAVDATGRRQHSVPLKRSPDRAALILIADTVTPGGVTLAYELSRN